MRTVAVVVGGAGVVLGAVKSCVVVLMWIVVGLFAGMYPTTLVDFALIGTEGVEVLFCVTGLFGVRLLARGDRTGVYLMLVATLGMATVVAAQPFLINVAGAVGIPENLRRDTGLPGAGWWVMSLIPVTVLLLASVLGALATRPTRNLT